MTKFLELTKAMINGEVPPAPVAKLIGFNLIAVEPGHAVFELQTTQAHANPMGTLHGGILCDIADAAMGIAYASNLAEGESFTTPRTQDKFPQARLERTFDSHRSCRQTGSHCRSG